MQILRKSYFEISKTYFLTATLHKWLPLLNSVENKQLIIDYLKELSERELLKVYAFVIMPTHLHFIWELVKQNGKETPKIRNISSQLQRSDMSIAIKKSSNREKRAPEERQVSRRKLEILYLFIIYSFKNNKLFFSINFL